MYDTEINSRELEKPSMMTDRFRRVFLNWLKVIYPPANYISKGRKLTRQTAKAYCRGE